ncbi:phosphate ABC transporter permease PstA [bacterium]|nr:phosphate ABC transporter permease PstA [bacterium]MDB4684003.1 phosphate ABC transporter permease PstA [bacterium]MDB4703320.1 phosphate ABC transporter permease PstA [bacterium]MDC0309438.1 phosphate ABC transporter permease PstA [bacterium]
MNDSQKFTATSFTRSKETREKWVRYLMFVVTLLMALPVVLLISYLVHKALPVLSLEFITDIPRNQMSAGGIWPAVLGTIYLVVLSLLVAAPVGVMAGVYLNEYAKENWFTRLINLAVINLAGVPSIVHALFGLGAFVLFAGLGESVIAASLTLAVMTMPVVITSTREALSAVPMSFREASWNMGVSRWQTIRGVVLPNSVSGILTGVILEVSRAAGETAPIMITGATASLTFRQGETVYYLLGEKFMALSYHLYYFSTQWTPPRLLLDEGTGEMLPMTQSAIEHAEAIPYGTAVVLLGVVLLFNSLSIAFRYYLRTHRKW